VVTQGGIENQIDVYCDADTNISYGTSVIIASFDAEKKRYLVIKDPTREQ
jgi:hypothetical protein